MKTKTPAPATTTITQCTNCNGDLAFNPAAQTLDCAFCNSSYTLQGEPVKTDAAVTEALQLIIPFAFAREVFDKAAVEWLSVGDFTPGDVLDSFHTNSTKGVYVPLYVWDIQYVIADPMGNKQGRTTAIAIPGVIKSWPAALIDFAKSTVIKKGVARPFEKTYTLGFELLDDEVLDADTFSANARAFALQTVASENRMADAKNVVISHMDLTRVYCPYWLNNFTWQGQHCEVIMSGFDAAKMSGVRPVDKSAENSKRPSLALSGWVFLTGLFILIAGMIVNSKGHSSGAFGVISMSLMVFVAPMIFFINLLRIGLFWKDPQLRLAKERQEKLIERLNQHK